MPEPTRRHPRSPFRALVCAGLLVLALGVASGSALGQNGPLGDAELPSCPPPAWCDPDPRSNPSPMMDAADALGEELGRRRQTGDCTGLGPQGCLALLVHQLMCAIDGRDWVQEYVCRAALQRELPAAAADDPEASAWLVDQLRQGGGSALGSIAIGDRATLALTVTDRFRDGSGRAMVFVEAVDSIDRRPILMAIGTDGRRTYVAELGPLFERSR